MSIHSRFAFPALLVALSCAAACTDDGDGSLKEVQIENRADVAVRIAAGDTDFGVVASGAMVAAHEVDDGPLALQLDGVTIDTLELGSDNVSGLWTLVVDRYETEPGVFSWTWGVALEQ